MLQCLRKQKYRVTKFEEKQKYHVTVRVGLRNSAAVFETIATECEALSGQRYDITRLRTDSS